MQAYIIDEDLGVVLIGSTIFEPEVNVQYEGRVCKNLQQLPVYDVSRAGMIEAHMALHRHRLQQRQSRVVKTAVPWWRRMVGK